MNKKLIRLTESDLHKIVNESVNKILKEGIASKGMRKQMFDKAYPKENDGNNYTTLRDILDGSERIYEIVPKVEQYLDQYCNNGHYSRWTSFGNSLYQDAVELEKKLNKIYNDYLNK